MRCGSLVLVLVAATELGGQAPEALQNRVREELSRRWEVPAERVVLDWGAVHWRGDSLPPLRLVGSGRGGWFVVVLDDSVSPSAVQVRAGLLDTVAVASRALAPGDTIGAGDYEFRTEVRWGAPAVRQRATSGWIVRRHLAAGDLLDEPSIAPPPVIGKGEPVRIVWQHGPVEVWIEGTAMNAAALHQPVRVRIPERNLQIVALAAAPGRATLRR